MRHLRLILCALPAILSPLKAEEDPSPAKQDAAPRWLILGEDADLQRTIAECDHVLLVCLYQTDLENVKPPFADIVVHATVVESFKGSHATGDKISIRFPTDSLPTNEEERGKFIEKAAKKNLGALKLAFLRGERSATHSCEWLDLSPYSSDLAAFVRENREAKPNPEDKAAKER